jgi:hypothetical protein
LTAVLAGKSAGLFIVNFPDDQRLLIKRLFVADSRLCSQLCSQFCSQPRLMGRWAAQ